MAAGMGIRLVPKLKYEHISLTLFSKMRVDLAAQVNKLIYLAKLQLTRYCNYIFCGQVLSESVSKALQLSVGSEASETAKFVGMMDKLFDLLNVHNYTHGVHARKRFQMPYTTSKDMRLKVGRIDI